MTLSMGLPHCRPIPPLPQICVLLTSLRLIIRSSSSLTHPSSSHRTPRQTYLLISSKHTLRLASSGCCCVSGAGRTCTASRSPFHPCWPIEIADADAHDDDDIDCSRFAVVRRGSSTIQFSRRPALQREHRSHWPFWPSSICSIRADL